MNIEPYYPRDPLLKNFIEYYYFLKTEKEFSAEYYAFPNTLQSFNIHKNAHCKITSHSTDVTGSSTDNFLMIVQGKHQLPLHVQLKDKLDKITILFKPLGLNHFVDQPLIELAGHPSQVFSAWSGESGSSEFLEAFYATDDCSERINILEAYLMSRYRAFPESSILADAISYLCDFESNDSIEYLAKKINMSVRSFNRLFLRHLGISPGGFRKIARFRHSLKNKILHDHFKSLTKISYESNYYDQAYFNKIYKKMTGQNPLGFFKSVEKLADDHLIFQFVNK